ncbi:hypothetical protein GW931_01250 [archaeon]|nr:hypothetical protein [archaeon]PJC45447.1 MAG: hypothetical protein CO037_01460 [Candidatus Pacearchaeota archaeon CG_4_9_14_0_2_um_filter_30_8]
MKIKIKARLINKKNPLLIIKKSDKISLRKEYIISFLDIKQDIEVSRILKNFNKENFKFEIGTKVKGYLKLDYQKDYMLELNEKEEKNE